MHLDERERPGGQESEADRTRRARLRTAADARAEQLRDEQAHLEEELRRLRRKASQ